MSSVLAAKGYYCESNQPRSMSDRLPAAFEEKYKIGRVIGEGTIGLRVNPERSFVAHVLLSLSPQCGRVSINGCKPAGNFSVVKECVKKSDGSKYAVKCINKNALNPKDRSNLVQEINILKEVHKVV